jgi:hypothetical protein
MDDVIINELFQQLFLDGFWCFMEIFITFLYHEIKEKYLGLLGDYMMVETC